MKLHRVLPAAALAALCLLPQWGTAQQPGQPTLRPAETAPAAIPPQTPVFRPVDPNQPGAAPAAAPANAGVWVPRTVTFTDLGFTEPVVLGYPDTVKEIYLPVPPGIAMSGGVLQLDASYIRADGGRT